MNTISKSNSIIKAANNLAQTFPMHNLKTSKFYILTH